MSIITDALKKAARERDGSYADMDGYLTKIAGPVRNEVYEGPPRPDAGTADGLLPESVKGGFPERRGRRATRFFVTLSGLTAIAIIALSAINLFFVNDRGFNMVYENIPVGDPAIPLEAEAYTKLNEELALIEKSVSSLGFKRGPKAAVDAEMVSADKFVLNGIVADEAESWALINNKVVKPGDRLEDATVIAINSGDVILRVDGKPFVLPAR